MNVLLTSVGRRVALLRAFVKELKAVFPEGRMLAADISRMAAGLYVADAGALVPACSSKEYVPALLELVRSENIRLLVPLIDTELLVLAEHRAMFGDVGCEVLVSEPELVRVSRDKSASTRLFAELGLLAPRGVALPSGGPEALAYPLFLKPADGSSSIGARRISGPADLRFFLERTPKPVLQEYIEGAEYTIDVFVDLSGRARCAVPRRRVETRAGEISKGYTERVPEIIDASMMLVNRLKGCRGCVTLQCFLTPERRVVFFEMNLRFGGGFPLSYAAGANYPRWAILMTAGREIPEACEWVEGVTMLRYDDAVFLLPERPR